MKGLGEEIVTPIIDQWSKDVDINMEKIQRSINEKDYEKIKFHSHYIKGSTLQIGCKKLGEMFKDLELNAMKEDDEWILNKFTSIKECLKATKIFVKEEYLH
jgi:hypothetical protein